MKSRMFGIYSKSGDLHTDNLLKAKKTATEMGLNLSGEIQDNFCHICIFDNQSIEPDLVSSDFFGLDGYINQYCDDFNNSFPKKEQNKFKILGAQKWYEQASGEFAFVTYSKKDKTLSIARDIFGARPMYIYKDDEKIIFGSEIKFIKNILNKKLIINDEKVLSFLCQFRKNTQDTFYKDVYSLDTGSIQSFFGHKMQHHKKMINPISYVGNLESAKEKLKKTLVAAMKNTITEKEPTAFLVSGGIDSAVVLKMAKHLNKDQVKPYTMNFFASDGERLSCDEDRYQKIILDGYSHQSINFKNKSPFENVDHWLKRFDQPFLLPNAYLYEKTYKTLRDKNINNIVDGNGGDSVFSHGWERFKELFSFKDLKKYIKEISNFAKIHNYDEYTKSNLMQKFTSALLRNNTLINRFYTFANYLLGRKRQRAIIIKNNYLKKIGYEDNYAFNRNFREHKEKIFNPIAESSFNALNILFFQYGIEHKSPLFYEELVKLMVSFPSEFKMNDGKSRFIIREAAKDDIPKAILNRYSKSNLSENFRKSVNNVDKKNILNEIKNPHPYIEKYLNEDVLLSEFNKFTKSNNESVSMNVWNYYLVNRWLKQHH